ncbi:hypothetical protein [Janthinobacterium lividum]|uniref:hypothetical protein n=2 Tax=Janthinobacterium lividum TaxID=29581 RepID=UPI0015955C9F|nr:hypothetical protein [Janthinobacterium lividum]QKY09527.1 hypothetical protein G8765_18405 [Janthinobacterium lividum]
MAINWKKEAASWYLAFFIVISFTLMFVALCVVLQDPKKGLASAEAASWVQAIGSMGAICGAIWIANRDTRMRREELLAIAIVSAADMQHKLQKLAQTIDRTIAFLVDNAGGYVPEAKIHEAINALTSRTPFTVEEVARLCPIDSKCAVRVARIQSAVENAKEILKSISCYAITTGHGEHLRGADVSHTEGALGVLLAQRNAMSTVREVLGRTVRDAL